MKKFTKQVKHRIYTVSVDIDANLITISRGRETGLVDSKPIFNDEGEFHFEHGKKEWKLKKTYRGIEEYGYVIPAENAENIVAEAVQERLKVLEPKVQRVRVPRAKAAQSKKGNE